MHGVNTCMLLIFPQNWCFIKQVLLLIVISIVVSKDVGYGKSNTDRGKYKETWRMLQ